MDTGRYVKDYRALQDDLRLNLRLGEHQLTAGVYYADYSMADRWSLGNLLLMDVSDQPRRLSLPGVTDPQGFTQYSILQPHRRLRCGSVRAYAADEWQVTEQLRLDLGVRYDDAEHRAAPISNAANVDLDGDPATRWDNVTSHGRRQPQAGRRELRQLRLVGRFQLRGRASETRSSVTTRIRRACRTSTTCATACCAKDPVTNVELGYKISHERFVVFATLFRTEFDNVSFNDIDLSGTPLVRTTGTRTSRIEVEGELLAADPLTIRFSMTVQDPKYREFRFHDAAGDVIDNTGNTVRRIPQRMWRVTPDVHLSRRIAGACS